MFNLLRWIIWFIPVFLFITFVIGIRFDVKKSKVIHPATFLQTLFFLLVVIFFLVKSWSKFHILWVLPVCFLLSFLTIAKIPIISRIALFFSYFFSGIILIGCKLPKNGQFFAYDSNENKNEIGAK